MNDKQPNLEKYIYTYIIKIMDIFHGLLMDAAIFPVSRHCEETDNETAFKRRKRAVASGLRVVHKSLQFVRFCRCTYFIVACSYYLDRNRILESGQAEQAEIIGDMK